ncbi:hypothetical protein [Caulobacter sp. NIBR1757]|uniref:hypothetical protein n=1 Tax=Caulobacter sp. NIBR1757 TaxID=3016000 RepID=UPI0022F02998|nr:hypothetical protein [Caulobacter sp. NIBR1757]WGM38172.1 hypothetical protein AMEJIAPC_01074 [Caulobacter sp. NIBR1757]
MKIASAALAALLVASPMVFAAAPVAAADLVMSKGAASALTESDVGKPYWVLHAQCAGIFSAGFAYRGDEADKSTGVAMFNAAIDRLVRDRGMERKAALALASDQLATGREMGNEMLARGGDKRTGPWNLQRSACLDIYEGYTGKFG